jgi:plasmid stabilization system protein ParE
MTTLFDVRMFGPRVTAHNGAYVATVRATQGALREQPDMGAVRDGLPHNLRKAFDRAGAFWFDKHDVTKPGIMRLYALRDSRHLATLTAERTQCPAQPE